MLSTPNKLQTADSQTSTPKTPQSILHSMQAWLLHMQCKSSVGRGACVFKNTSGRAVEEFALCHTGLTTTKHSATFMRSGCLNKEGWRWGLPPTTLKAAADLQYSNQGTAGCRKTATPHLVHYKMTQPICTSACCNLPNLPWQKHLD